jgi:hypothetical protein
MKVIDKTLFQDPQGNVSPIDRVQGTLKYGFSWYSELAAQKQVIAQLNRHLLDKGFVLIRNFTLPDIEAVIPMILIGPGSISIMLVTPVKGEFEANDTEWNIIKNGVSTPVARNPIKLLIKLTRAFQKYLDIHKINIPVKVEPILIASDPGANIQSGRPAVRVLRSDAIKQFANTLNQASPSLRAEQILSAVDLILDPQSAPAQLATPPVSEEIPLSRAQAIFKAGETADPAAQSTRTAQTPRPAQAKPAQTTKKKSRGVSGRQIILLAVLGIFECCVLAGGVYFLFFFQQ